MGRVIVVGSLNVDRPWSVVRHPVVGATIFGEMLPVVAGGKGLNQAVAARRMGARTTMVGRVGDDADGRWLLQVAGDEGIDTSAVRVLPGAPTGSALIVVAADGSNTVTVAPGANSGLGADDGPEIEPDDVVVSQLEVPVDAVAAVLARCRSVGATSILNPSPIGPGSALASEADIVVVNEHEAAELAGSGAVPRDPESAIATARRGLAAGSLGRRLAVVTLGAGGAVVVGPGVEATFPGVPVDAVDTVGAGDCFLGVLAAGLADGRDPVDAADRANRAAALSVTRRGAVDAMPHAHELA